jgi:hypothetical protein
MAKYYLTLALVAALFGATTLAGLSLLTVEAQACSSPPCPGK